MWWSLLLIRDYNVVDKVIRDDGRRVGYGWVVLQKILKSVACI